MNKLFDHLPDRYAVFAVAACTLMMLAAADKDLGFDILGLSPEPRSAPDQPKPEETPNPKPEPRKDRAAPFPRPDVRTGLAPYAPSPGRDDRTPIEYASQVFGLNDPELADGVSGVGPVLWKGQGQGTGALIARDVVLTTAHLFVKNGNWTGANGAVPVPPPASNGFIYLAACGRSYAFSSIEVGSEAPRSRLGLDYAIAKLAQPACTKAEVLPVIETPDDLSGLQGDDARILNIGSYWTADLPRVAEHPLFTGRKTRSDGMHKLHVFAVKCRITGFQSTGDVAGGSTGLVITNGCDGVPGGSGGPLIAAQGEAGDYRIIGVANSYRPSDPEYNNYTRIEGAFADHLRRHVALAATTAANAEMDEEAGPVLIGEGDWRAMNNVAAITRKTPSAMRHSLFTNSIERVTP